MTFTDARHAARMTLDDVAEYLEISISTVRRYDKKSKAPKAVIECLRMIGGYFPAIALPRNGFEGWRMRGGYLWSPGNEKFTSGDVIASKVEHELNHSLEIKIKELELRLASIDKRKSNILYFPDLKKRNERA
jgi:transcriptional regulator with XRE-family HTH domain